ncbi:major facilitator superfamily MFS-1 [Marasmius fiardii PR-910]|nr:major facilitator superfamily MFS-1 [Marasmius fiardii PR-910]
MSTPKSFRRGSTSHRSFGQQDSALDDATPSTVRRTLARISSGIRRPSWAANLRSNEFLDGTKPERAPIPSVVQSSGEAYITPLPTLPMVVLSIAMLGEFLSANVSSPFILFMVKGFGKITDEAEIAFWTGILVSTFFLTQFLTSLLWATVAEKHGRRLVLVVSLLGTALTCAAFGTSTSLPQAICIRLLQGIFAGAVGVARGSVSFISDATNEGRAYAILGFCWGFGGVAGAIIGGSFERPADKWPEVFAKIPLFKDFPYLLPCGLAALIMLTGSLLACFLGPDGGPREGGIRLPAEKYDVPPTIPEEQSEPPTPVFEATEPQSLTRSIGRRLSQKLSGYFGKVQTPQAAAEPLNVQPPVPLSPSRDRRTYSRTSRFGGSAYGYGSYRNRIASNATVASRVRTGSLASNTVAHRRGSNIDGRRDSMMTESGDLNFAQRLLMANENAVTNIADLWVAAAMNVDNEDPFETDTEEEIDDDDESLDLGELLHNNPQALDAPQSEGTSPIAIPNNLRRGSRSSAASKSFSGSPLAARQSLNIPKRYGASPSPRRPSGVGGFQSASQNVAGAPSMLRRHSSGVPVIFSHPGVKTPAAVLDAQQLLLRSEVDATGSVVEDDDVLAPILESRRASRFEPNVNEAVEEKPPSLFSQIPIMIILQYGCLALHGTTHDQIFMSYLVTDYNSGGLNLNAGHFAQLIALMCLAQIAYQFYLYPNLGPPRGRFSHLTMFRLGSLLFIPSYLTVVLYRVPFASEEEDGNFMLMTALAVSTAVRYCASTFGYTAISILLNYMTPPNAIGFANGIAQSIVSLARCFGPILGGTIWSISIEKNPNGYPVGFVICAGFCALCILHSFTIR